MKAFERSYSLNYVSYHQEFPHTAQERSSDPSPVAIVKPMSKSPKHQPPCRRQPNVGPIMVHTIPLAQSVSPPLPYYAHQQQQMNIMENVKIREDADMTDNPSTMKHKLDAGDEEDERDDLPFDPNLVCVACNKQFRIGEIYELRKHYKSCQMKPNKEETIQLDPLRHIIAHGC